MCAGLLLMREGESREEYTERVDKARGVINKRLFTLVHACFQVRGLVGGGGCVCGQESEWGWWWQPPADGGVWHWCRRALTLL